MNRRDEGEQPVVASAEAVAVEAVVVEVDSAGNPLGETRTSIQQSSQSHGKDAVAIEILNIHDRHDRHNGTITEYSHQPHAELIELQPIAKSQQEQPAEPSKGQDELQAETESQEDEAADEEMEGSVFTVHTLSDIKDFTLSSAGGDETGPGHQDKPPHHLGLSTSESLEKLLRTAEKVLEEFDDNLSPGQCSLKFLLLPSTILTIVSALCLIAFFAYVVILATDQYQWRATGALVEGILLLLLTIWNMRLFVSEKILTANELRDKARGILSHLKAAGLNYRSEAKVPTFVPSVSVSRVYRDGQLRICPSNLLVEGDIIQLTYGDLTPGRVVELVHQKQGREFGPQVMINPKEHFRDGGRMFLLMLETPIENQLREMIQNMRPKNVIQNQLNVFTRIFLRWILFGILIASIIVNVLRFAIGDFPNQVAFEVVIVMPIYTIIGLLPLCIPTVMLATRAFGNAELLNLFEQLQESKTEYEDDEDVDEFDAAPPPTKDVRLDKWKLIKRFVKLFWGHEEALTRSCSLMENLGHTSCICVIDREGTLSDPLPRPEQIFFLDDNGEPIILDVDEDEMAQHGVRFDDKDWQIFLSSLKPFGLNALVNTDCGVLARKRNEYHRKCTDLNYFPKTLASRQTCLCLLGREIGFKDDAIASYLNLKSVLVQFPTHRLANHTKWNWEVPSIHASVVMDLGTPAQQHSLSPNSYHLFSDGSLPLLLQHCADYWNGYGLSRFEEDIDKRIHEFYQTALANDMQVIGYSYRPLSIRLPELKAFLSSKTRTCVEVISKGASPNDKNNDQNTLNPLSGDRTSFLRHKFKSAVDTDSTDDVSDAGKMTEGHLCSELIKGQTFLCCVTYGHQPKENVVDFIEDLNLAGIRFVFFSESPERESKAYGERLGLEIGWNSCILLSPSSGEGNDYLELHDIKARLPRGIDKIRWHIENVDDIPLHVNLFAETYPYATREMIKIFQEYGEVVCCIGGALNINNPLAFAMADISIAVEPFASFKARSHSSVSSFAAGAHLNSLPTALMMHSDTSLFSLSQIIREARTFMTSAKQALSLAVGCQLAISLILLLSNCLLLPPIFQGYQILFILWFLVPLLSLSLLFNPHDPEVMTSMTAKNLDHDRDVKRVLVYFAIRFAPLVIMPVVLFVLALGDLYNQGNDHAAIFGDFGSQSWMTLSSVDQHALIFAQNVALWAFVFYMVIVSITFIHRTRSLKEFPPHKNLPWVACCIACIGLQTVFFAVSASSSPYSLGQLSWYIYVLAFAWIIPLLGIQGLVKVHDKEEWDRFQKRSKLEFNTKLGMHSPL